MKPFFISLVCFSFLAALEMSRGIPAKVEPLDYFLTDCILVIFLSLLVQAFVSLVLRLNPFFNLRKTLIILAKNEFVIFYEYERNETLYKINLNQQKVFKFKDEVWQEIQEFPKALPLKNALKFIEYFKDFAKQNTQNLLLNHSHNIFYARFAKAFKDFDELHFDPFILKLKRKEFAKTLVRFFVFMFITFFVIPVFMLFVLDNIFIIFFAILD
ncbi:hypothetical protein CQA38_03455 [Campylobacter sp. MIT 12-5580]|uniref:hypothetical protein n=1 Tax=Campylobacter sp. MIT 12-5580 TaxID=2040651 RepID=UPI0010FA15DD|nr:hypothetical protein [Campylobacter sp. MIT 12-5580]TKX29834.1 hypothetical protein CQA38_03455 [Campylobacter sp. MIT 12-5580]